MVFDLRHEQQAKQLGFTVTFCYLFSCLALPGGRWLWTVTPRVSPGPENQRCPDVHRAKGFYLDRNHAIKRTAVKPAISILL